MAAVQKAKLRGSAPKVRNKDRGPGYWVSLHNARNNKARALPSRDARHGINYPRIGDVGSAAYRRLRAHGRG